jgi:A/G-specific adenine glycosylase
VVDTNVRRWLIRRFSVADRPNDLQRLADELAGTGSHGDTAARSHGDTAAWTHASMEFGAAICTARAPRCHACPVARGCPSRGNPATIAVPRQAPFGGSSRARRGAVLRALAAAAGHRLPGEALRATVDGSLADPAWVELLALLERDGLIHRSEGLVVLGPGAGPTIGP